MTVSSNGGQPRELSAWSPMAGASANSYAWTSDGRYLLYPIVQATEDASSERWEWFAFPVEGGNPLKTGAGDALRAAGSGLAGPMVMTGDRVLYYAGASGHNSGRNNAWELHLSPGSWHVRGLPRQLTFGTLDEIPISVSATGTVALEVAKYFNDVYLIPISASTGQPTGISRRLTQDGQDKACTLEGAIPEKFTFGSLTRTSMPRCITTLWTWITGTRHL